MEVDPAVEEYCAVKLILQPILENAINYGVSGMDDSENYRHRKDGGEDVLLAVKDNGIGIPAEEAALLLTDSNRVHKHGSGVGLVNVNQRDSAFIWQGVWAFH